MNKREKQHNLEQHELQAKKLEAEKHEAEKDAVAPKPRLNPDVLFERIARANEAAGAFEGTWDGTIRTTFSEYLAYLDVKAFKEKTCPGLEKVYRALRVALRMPELAAEFNLRYSPRERTAAQLEACFVAWIQEKLDALRFIPKVDSELPEWQEALLAIERSTRLRIGGRGLVLHKDGRWFFDGTSLDVPLERALRGLFRLYYEEWLISSALRSMPQSVWDDAQFYSTDPKTAYNHIETKV